MIRTLILLLILLAFTSVGISKEITLTLYDALELAEKNDPELSTARLDIEIGDAEVRGAFAAAFPTIDASGSLSRFMIAPTSYIPSFGNMRFVPIMDYSYNLSLRQPVWLAGKIGLGLKAAKTYRRIAHASISSIRANIKSQIVQDYYGLMLSREVVLVTQETLDQAKRNAEAVKRLYDNGMSSEFDLLRAQVAVKSLEPELSNVVKFSKLAEIKLADRLGLDPSSVLILDGELIETSPKERALNFSDYYNQAISSRAEFVQFDLQDQLQDISLKVERRSIYWPNVSFTMNYRRQAQQDFFNLDNLDWTESFNWILQVDIPLFNGFSTQSRIQKAQIEIRRSALQRKILEQGVRLEITNALAELERAKSQVIGQKATVEMARKAHTLSQTRYEQGIGTELEVLDVQLTLRNARLGYLQGLYDLRVAEAEYFRIVENDDDLTK